jgi:hypothetical protein
MAFARIPVFLELEFSTDIDTWSNVARSSANSTIVVLFCFLCFNLDI